MTEKRYKHEYVNCEVSEIIDTYTNESMTAEEITDILNKQHEENQALISIKNKYKGQRNHILWFIQENCPNELYNEVLSTLAIVEDKYD